MPPAPTAAAAAVVHRVYVGGLPPGVGAEQLRQRFSPFGTVQDVTILAPTALGDPRSFAYVTLAATEPQWRRCRCSASSRRTSALQTRLT